MLKNFQKIQLHSYLILVYRWRLWILKHWKKPTILRAFLWKFHSGHICTILDINCYTNEKCGQKVLFRERAKSAYFRSASSDSDNKWLFALGLGTRFLLPLFVSSQWSYDWPKILNVKSIWKIYRFVNYIYKSFLQFLWYEIPLKL